MRRVAAGLRRVGSPEGAGCVVSLVVAAIVSGLPQALPANDDLPATNGTRVEITLEVRGELFAEANPDHSPLTQPIQLDARFGFIESASPVAQATVCRRFHTATADYTSGGRTTQSLLSADAREILVVLRGTTPSPYLADGFLSREEADLLEMPFDAALVDRLVPSVPVTAGVGWNIEADLTAGLLAIDTVESGSLEGILLGVENGVASVGLAGTVTGAVDGAPTRIVMTGALHCAATTADDEAWLLSGRVESLEAEIAERREAGWVAPGLDVNARLKLVRSSVDRVCETADGYPSGEDTDQLGPIMADRPHAPGRPGTVWERHRQGRYALVLDERWRVVEDGSEGLVMRFVDHGALVAQCSILPLPRTGPDAAPSMETVRRDVERSLGEQFGLVVSADETTRSDGTRVVRVVAEGTAEDRPFRWIHHVLTDPVGHRAAVTCMHEVAAADRFAIADRELVAGLVLVADRPANPPREARLPAAAAALPHDGENDRISLQAP